MLPCSGSSGLFFAFPKGTRVVSSEDIQLCATGRVTVTFAGDRAAGCGARGLCAYHGTESWSAQGDGDVSLITVARRGHRSTFVSLSVGGFGAPDRSSVARDRRGAAPATCQDRAAGEGGLGTGALAGGHVAIRLGAPGLATLGTRCAGPLLADVASVLPRRTVSLARLRRGHLKIDLGGSSHFSAGGFSGTVDSTVTLALAGRDHQPLPPPGRARARSRIATARYRITDVSGAATTTVRASGTHSVCAPLDACGLHGAITLTPRRAARSQLVLTALGSHRRSRRDLLTALGVRSGGNPEGIGIGGAGGVSSVGGRAAISRGGSPCTDSVIGDALEIDLRQRGSRLQAQASPTSMTGTDPLRSRCPGPTLGQRTFSRGSLPLTVLHRPQFTIRLHGTSFRDGPYTVDTRSSIAITVRRQSVSTQLFGG